jgi:hypothetical protein
LTLPTVRTGTTEVRSTLGLLPSANACTLQQRVWRRAPRCFPTQTRQGPLPRPLPSPLLHPSKRPEWWGRRPLGKQLRSKRHLSHLWRGPGPGLGRQACRWWTCSQKGPRPSNWQLAGPQRWSKRAEVRRHHHPLRQCQPLVRCPITFLCCPVDWQWPWAAVPCIGARLHPSHWLPPPQQGVQATTKATRPPCALSRWTARVAQPLSPLHACSSLRLLGHARPRARQWVTQGLAQPRALGQQPMWTPGRAVCRLLIQPTPPCPLWPRWLL